MYKLKMMIAFFLVITQTFGSNASDKTIVECSNGTSKASIVKVNADYKLKINGDIHELEVAQLGTDTLSFIKNDFGKDVDLILYAYRSGSLDSSKTMLELFEDDWNSVAGVFAKYDEKDCSTKFE